MAVQMILEKPNCTTWDAYEAFHITGRFSYSMSCFGENRQGRRCAWTIPKFKYDDLRQILDYIETQPPQDAAKYLPDIASLSLCEDFHQNQAYGLEAQWREMLKTIPYAMAKGPTLEEKIQKLEKRVEEEHKAKSEAEKLIVSLRTLLEEHRMETERYKDQCSRLEISLGGQLHTERQNITAEQQKVEQLETERDVREKRLHELYQLVKKHGEILDTSNASHDKQLQILETETKNATKLHNDMKRQISEQEADLNSRASDIQRLEDTKLQLLSEIERLQHLHHEREEVTDSLENERAHLYDQNSSLHFDFEESKREIEALKVSIADVESNRREISARAEDLHNALEAEREARLHLQEANGKLSDKSERFEKELAARARDASAMLDEIKELKLVNSDLFIEKGTLQTNAESKEEEVAAMLGRLQLSHQQVEDSRQRPFRFMTRCWLEKARKPRRNHAVEGSGHHDE